MVSRFSFSKELFQLKQQKVKTFHFDIRPVNDFQKNK